VSVPVLLLIYTMSLGLLIVEVFIPGGIVGSLGFVGVLTALTFTWTQHGVVAGGALTLFSALFGLGLVRLTLSRVSHTDAQSSKDGYVAVETGLEALRGRLGRVESQLRPVGTARFDDAPVTVITRGELIEVGAEVKVIDVAGDRVVVTRTTATNKDK
jgi:membrane-bound serine protease (ClpP class)